MLERDIVSSCRCGYFFSFCFWIAGADDAACDVGCAEPSVAFSHALHYSNTLVLYLVEGVCSAGDSTDTAR